MQLRVIEIEAIKTRILNELSSKMEYPDFTNQLNSYKEALLKYQELQNKINEINREIKVITREHPSINMYFKSSSDDFVDVYFNNYKKKLQTEYKNSKLPTALDIQNDIILSSNKDLSELVKELISKYSK